jgi:hypothetical protein
MELSAHNIILYLISFVVLYIAEIAGTLHGIFLIKDKKHFVAIFDGISSVCWCIKIIVVINQPLTIITAFIGAYMGAMSAFKIEKCKILRNLAEI